jgi:hypothetical protein
MTESFEFDGDGNAEYRALAAQAIHTAVMTRASALYLAQDAERRSAEADALDATEEARENYALTLMAAEQAQAQADEAYEHSVFAHQAYVNAMAATAASQIAGIIIVLPEDD